MGESRRNPRSPAFTGQLPEFHIEPLTGHGLVATPEWVEANKDALAGPNPPTPRPEECNILVKVAIQMVYPSGLVGIEHWKNGTIQVGQINIPFAKFKEAIDAQIAARDQAPAIVVPGEVPAG